MRGAALTLAIVLSTSPHLAGQGRGAAQPPAPPAPPQQAAPIDLTGTWVSVVTEDWRWRMVTPPRGDYASIPLTATAKAAADKWDPARDEAAGEQCRGYGAPGVMRLPTRLRIAWQDERTLKVDTDTGMQTRLLRFDPVPRRGRPSWQGDSVAEWEIAGRRGGAARAGGAAGRAGAPPPPRFGNLKVVTSNLRPGYLRKNGVPYSADAVVTEYWDLFRRQNGEQWLVVTMAVRDPANLQGDWITSLNFKKEPDASKWDPTPCSAK